MLFIVLDEVLPIARQHGHQSFTAVGIILDAFLVVLPSGIFGV